MNASELKYHVEQAGIDKFFDRRTMKFFGDTMRNYGVRDAGDNWELYRKRAVKFGNQQSAFFDKIDFRLKFPRVTP